MTELMQHFIERLREIPEEEQDKYAATYLKELEDDQRWEELFARTTEEQWEKVKSNLLCKARRLLGRL